MWKSSAEVVLHMYFVVDRASGQYCHVVLMGDGGRSQ